MGNSTNNLNGPRIAESQANKYLTANDGVGTVDAAVTDTLDLAADNTNLITLTGDHLRGYHTFIVTEGSPGPTGVVTIHVPAIKRGDVTFINSTTQNFSILIVAQSEAAASIPAGDTSSVNIDGTNVRPMVAGGTTGLVPSPVQTIAGTTYSLLDADKSTYQRCTNAAGCAITVPANADEAIAISSEYHFRQSGAGALTVWATTSAVVINGIDNFYDRTAVRGAVITLKKIDTDEWDLFGLLEAV